MHDEQGKTKFLEKITTSYVIYGLIKICGASVII